MLYLGRLQCHAGLRGRCRHNGWRLDVDATLFIRQHLLHHVLHVSHYKLDKMGLLLLTRACMLQQSKLYHNSEQTSAVKE